MIDAATRALINQDARLAVKQGRRAPRKAMPKDQLDLWVIEYNEERARDIERKLGRTPR